jgi:PhnB protein
MEIAPYLNFDGNCAEAMRFYEQVLGGKLEALMTHRGSPAEAHTPAEWQDKILHARLVVGSYAIMASDAPPGHYTKSAGSYISLSPESVEEGKRIYDGLSEGGTVHMPWAATFWSPGFGMLADRFGTHWMVNAGRPA